MVARIRKLVSDLGETFWLWPGLMVLAGTLTALACVRLDRSAIIPQWLLERWLYNGGGTRLRNRIEPVTEREEGVGRRN